MPGLGPGKAARRETWSGSRHFLRHPRMDNQILTLWETVFCGFLCYALRSQCFQGFASFGLSRLIWKNFELLVSVLL